MKTRVRFAPSPTGPQHIGGIRTALYNYLVAKKAGGDFILRIEDTDSSRYVPESEEYILEALKWAGIKPTEGITADWKIAEEVSPENPHAPYRQSQRKEIYKDFAFSLVASGSAYIAFDTTEEIEKVREEYKKGGREFSYNVLSRKGMINSLVLSEEETQELMEIRKNWVIRFKMPEESRVIEMHDEIRGDIKVYSGTLDDKVLWKKSDELPTYHLANVVDDHLMEISDVIRGEEWLPSLPLHILLYESFGWEAPRFSHLPLILKPKEMGPGKLSKRDGAIGGFPVFPISWNSKNIKVQGYREAGYFPEAFVNFLAYLGWNPGNEDEIKSIKELIRDFSISRCQRAGARFDPKKTIWYNREYLRTKTPQELLDVLRPTLITSDFSLMTDEFVLKIISFLKDRLDFPADIFKQGQVFFKESPGIRLKDWNEYQAWIPSALELYEKIKDSDVPRPIIEEYVSNLSDGWKSGVKIMNALRMIISGNPKGPDLPTILEILGPKTLKIRMDKFRNNYGY